MNQQIGNAEYELGRYRKKVKDQTDEIRRLKKEVEDAIEGVKEIRKSVDALISSVAKEYGEKVADDATGETIGYRIKVRYPFVLDDRFYVQCKKWPDSDDLTIGLIKKMEE